MDEWPKYKSKNYKLLEEITGINLHDLGVGNRSLAMTPKAGASKNKQIRLQQNFRKLCSKGHCHESKE